MKTCKDCGEMLQGKRRKKCQACEDITAVEKLISRLEKKIVKLRKNFKMKK